MMLLSVGPASAEPGSGYLVIEGSDTAYNRDWYPEIPPPRVYESSPPAIAAKRIGSGAVVAAGIGRTTNGGIAYPTEQRWETGELDVLFDKAFQWMKEGATNVLWYGHHEEGATTYNRLVYNYADRGSWLIDSLRTKGYTVDNTVGTADLITSSLLAPYEILVLPQLQGGPTGGDPDLLPSEAVTAIKDFVEGGGGLFIMESGDYDGYNYFKIQNKILEALNFGLFFQHDTIFDPESDDERYITAIVTDDEFGTEYKAETGKNTIKLYKVATLELPEPGVVVGIAPRYQASLPGSTLTFTISVFNKDEVEDTYSLTVNDDLGWGLSLLETSLNVPGRETKETTLSVTIPIGATIDAEDDIVVTATSTVKDGVSDTDASIVRAARITTPPVDDTYTHEARATTKFGDKKTLYTGWYDDGSERTLLKFDLSGLPGDLSIGKAKLWIYNYSLTEGGSSGVKCHRVDDDDWSEGAVTWNSQPAYGAQLGDPVPVTDTGWFSWDVTSFVQEEFGGDKKVSFSLIDIEEDTEVSHSTWFASKEYDDSEKWPYLEIPLPYAVNVTITPWIQDISAGGTLTYTVTVQNVGSETDSYNLSVTDTQGWERVIAQNLFTNVQYGESKTTTLTVTVPSDASSGTKDTITVTATSQADPTVSDSYDSIARAFEGVKLSPDDDAHVSSGFVDSIYGGEDTLYLRSDTRDFKNQRMFLKFDLSAIPSDVTVIEAEVWLWSQRAELADINAQCWSVTDDVFLDEVLITWGTQPDLVALLDTVALKYSPPSEGMWVLWDVTEFVIDEFAGDKKASFGIRAEVEDLSGRYRFNSKEWSGEDKDPHLKILYTTISPGVDISVSPSSKSDSPGSKLTYTVTVVNEGDAEDTYDLTITDPLAWGATVSPTSLTIGAGGSGTATVSVTIPDGTADDTEDEITVRVTSRTTSTVSDSATCTARATVEGEGLPMTLIAIVVVVVVIVVVAALVLLRGRKAAPSWSG
ncbi:MAG: DNRLRE domain-containing protein [Hadesarchaea archaeon]|nr:DNRLRE domain-containing protein [Hadesarchaea archaeon]